MVVPKDGQVSLTIVNLWWKTMGKFLIYIIRWVPGTGPTGFVQTFDTTFHCDYWERFFELPLLCTLHATRPTATPKRSSGPKYRYRLSNVFYWNVHGFVRTYLPSFLSPIMAFAKCVVRAASLVCLCGTLLSAHFHRIFFNQNRAAHKRV